MTTRKKHPDIEYRPLYEQIEDSLLGQLGKRYKVGDCIPPMAELAEFYGVDLITVKRALMELSHKGYISSGRGRRSQVLKAPSREITAILIELDYTHEACSPYYRLMVEGICRELESQGIQYRIYKGTLRNGERPQRLTSNGFMEDLEAGQIGGTIALGTDPTLDFYRRARELGVPVLGLGAEYASVVKFNTLGGVDLGVSMLSSLGCKYIAVVGWRGYRDENQDNYSYFEWTFEHYGLQFRPYWFRSDTHPLVNGAGWEEFYEIWVGPKDKPDSIFVMDDMMLPDVLQALRDFGLKAGHGFPVCCITGDYISGSMLREGEEVICVYGNSAQKARVVVSTYRRLLQGERIGELKIPMKLGVLTKSGLVERGAADLISWKV